MRTHEQAPEDLRAASAALLQLLKHPSLPAVTHTHLLFNAIELLEAPIYSPPLFTVADTQQLIAHFMVRPSLLSPGQYCCHGNVIMKAPQLVSLVETDQLIWCGLSTGCSARFKGKLCRSSTRPRALIRSQKRCRAAGSVKEPCQSTHRRSNGMTLQPRALCVCVKKNV